MEVVIRINGKIEHKRMQPDRPKLASLPKPSPCVFDYVLEKLASFQVAKSDILHTAQSQYHDIIPAMKSGFFTTWIERRQGENSFRATPEPNHLMEATYHANSMSEFVRQVHAHDK